MQRNFCNMYCIFKLLGKSFKWLTVFQFWELMSKNEISRTKSYIYFMKIWVASWFPTTGPSLLCIYTAHWAGEWWSCHHNAEHQYILQGQNQVHAEMSKVHLRKEKILLYYIGSDLLYQQCWHVFLPSLVSAEPNGPTTMSNVINSWWDSSNKSVNWLFTF